MSRDAGRVPQDEPLAYFLTWTTYGSWLPGDERGWVEKPGEFLPPDAHLEQASRSLMTEPPLILDSTQRELVENTIADHCRHRGWHLHAVACRTHSGPLCSEAGHAIRWIVSGRAAVWCGLPSAHREPSRHRASRAAAGRETGWGRKCEYPDLDIQFWILYFVARKKDARHTADRRSNIPEGEAGAMLGLGRFSGALHAPQLSPPLPPLRKGGKVGGVWSFFPPCEGGTQGGSSSASALRHVRHPGD